MFEDILESNTKKFVENIKGSDFPPLTYLAGGTAIALQIGHRKSFDLDFFTPTEFKENQWEQKFVQDWDFKIIQRDWQTLTGEIKNIKFSLFYYKYKLINQILKFKNISIASLEDLSAMKLDTIISRSTKRDFIDIYYLAKKFGMNKLFKFYEDKYGNLEEKELMIKKALLYFDEADLDEMPNMLIDTDWNMVKKFFKTNITQ